MKTLEMNPSLKTYEVVLRWVNLPNYRTKVKATNAMLARDKAVEKHRLETGCGKDELLDCLATTALSAGQHLWLDDDIASRQLISRGSALSACDRVLDFCKEGDDITAVQLFEKLRHYQVELTHKSKKTIVSIC